MTSGTFKIVAVSAALFASTAFSYLATTATTAFAGELNLLTWEGYTDQSFIAAFEERTGCKITETFIGSQEEIAPKLSGATGVYDLVSPQIDSAKILAQMGVVEPIDVPRLKHWGEFYGSFIDHPGLIIDGETWGMPFTWGSVPLMYRTDKIDDPPSSFSVLWDPRYAGKTAVQDDKSNIYIAARLLFGRDFDAYKMTDEQLETVKEKLIEQKKYLRKYWASAGELINLYANGEVWISTTWGGYQVAILQEQGIPVVEVLPEERAEGWQDVWMIVKDTANRDCAYEWLNFASGSEGQCGVASVTGYWGANPVALESCMTPDIFRPSEDYTDNLSFPTQPEPLEGYVNTWNAVKTAP